MPYNAGDLKWGDTTLGTPSGTITWSVNYGEALNFAPGYSQGDFDAALIAAFDAWEDVASIDFQMVPYGEPADVVVGSASLGGAAGIAEYTFDGNPGLSEIYSGTITFNSDLTWSPYGEPGGINYYAVALHEIGHIIGLGHVNDTSEIMNPIIYANDLGSGDIAGAQYLYGRDPGDAPEPEGEGPEEPVVDGGSGGGGGGGAGLLVGLLAALLAMLFGGGAAAGVAMAAGRVASKDDTTSDDHDHLGHDNDIISDGIVEQSHTVYVAEMPLPAIPIDEAASPCGCYGPCDCADGDLSAPEFLF